MVKQYKFINLFTIEIIFIIYEINSKKRPRYKYQRQVPEKVVADLPSPKEIALKPVDFPNLVPKLLVKEGDLVKCGSPVFLDKYNDKINFSSPVSGKINKIIRGEKRRILAVTITSDDKFTQLNKITKDYSTLDREELKNDLLKWVYGLI